MPAWVPAWWVGVWHSGSRRGAQGTPPSGGGHADSLVGAVRVRLAWGVYRESTAQIRRQKGRMGRGLFLSISAGTREGGDAGTERAGPREAADAVTIPAPRAGLGTETDPADGGEEGVEGILAAASSAAAPIVRIIENVRGLLVGLLTVLAIVALVYAGIRYLLAGGDPTGVERAKGAAKSAMVGFGLALLAPVIITVLSRVIDA